MDTQTKDKIQTIHTLQIQTIQTIQKILKQIADIQENLKIVERKMKKIEKKLKGGDHDEEDDESSEEFLCDTCKAKSGIVEELTFTDRLKKITLPLTLSLIAFSFMGVINDYYYPRN